MTEAGRIGDDRLADDAPSAHSQFSSLHDIRFGKLAVRALAPPANLLATPVVPAPCHDHAQSVPVTRAGLAHVFFGARDARDSRRAYVRSGARGGALRGARPKRISWSDGAHLAAVDTRAGLRLHAHLGM